MSGKVFVVDFDFVAVSMKQLGIGEVVAEVGVGGGISDSAGGNIFGIGSVIERVAINGLVLGSGAVVEGGFEIVERVEVEFWILERDCLGGESTSVKKVAWIGI